MTRLREAFQTLYQRNAVLALMGLAHLAAALVLLAALPFESRQLLGINLWIKPIKFFLSAAIYLWTLAILLAYLKTAYPRSIRVISWSTATAMLVENACIAGQAARGVTSHFNESTLFDGVLFGVMGLFILLNTLVMIWATWLFCRFALPVPRAYGWGIRLGFLLFLSGNLIGGAMIGAGSHNVGVAMGGAGLPLVNWSLEGGDLRTAHFLGLHALQFIPLAGYLFSRDRSASSGWSVAAISVFALLYGTAILVLYFQAMNGLPLMALFNY